LQEKLLKPKPDKICNELGIPKRLRRNKRESFDEFHDSNENLYRWFAPEIEYLFDGTLSPSTVGKVFSPPRDISCNRSRFCDYPTDVLFNTNNLPHRNDFGIIKTSILLIEKYRFSVFVSNNKNIEEEIFIEFQVIHSPEECMYPHSEIIVLRNGKRIEGDVKPKKLKTLLREELSRKFKVCHLPTPNFAIPLK
jgi:hypothetical protein